MRQSAKHVARVRIILDDENVGHSSSFVRCAPAQAMNEPACRRISD
ncbi:hypothetical protein DP43_5510 [Burkholderia pseudomallei]|nr:hypothetical protein DP43_5510 [Burkholderia pseudomallei]